MRQEIHDAHRQAFCMGSNAMSETRIHEQLLSALASNWQSLNDRPEETPESTLKALWFLAVGKPRAVQRCDDALPPLSEPAQERLAELVRQRSAGVPLAHLTGRQCFMGIEMLAGPEALIPRKETEILGYGALRLLRELVASQGQATVVDVCTGGGNLALALARYVPGCRVHAADISAEAIELARRNAQYLGLAPRISFAVGDLFAPLDECWLPQVPAWLSATPLISPAIALPRCRRRSAGTSLSRPLTEVLSACRSSCG